MTKNLKPIPKWKTVSVFGIIVMVIGYGLILWGGGYNSQFLIELGLGIFAIGVPLLAFGYALKTDEVVTSLANLNFDEKIAAIKGYGENLNPQFNDDLHSIRKGFFRLRWDLKAVSHLEKFADIEQKMTLKDTITEIMYHFNNLEPVVNIDNGDISDREHETEMIKNEMIKIEKILNRFYDKSPTTIENPHTESAPTIEKKKSLSDGFMCKMYNNPRFDNEQFETGIVITLIGCGLIYGVFALFYGSDIRVFSALLAVSAGIYFVGFNLFVNSFFRKDRVPTSGSTDQMNKPVSQEKIIANTDKETKWLNASMLFLSLVIVIAAACAIAVAVLALPPDKIGTGISIEGIFIILIVVSGLFTKRLFKL